MIKIKTIASSSKGNSYLITDGKTPILIEAGLPLKKIREASGFSLSKIQGCLCSHAHGDHSKSISALMKSGIVSYMSLGTCQELGISGHRLNIVKSLGQFNLGSWKILPFDTIHDALEPLGFLLKSGDEKLLFITDSAYCRYVFKKINYLMLECNYQEEILHKNIESGLISKQQKDRLIFSHFSLKNALEFIQNNDMSHLKETHLLHLSEDNSNAAAMKEAVQKATGKPVYIAE